MNSSRESKLFLQDSRERVDMDNNRTSRKLQIAAVFLVLSLAQAFAQGPVLPDPGNTRITRDQQRELGLQAAAEVYKQMPVLPDSSPETQYIRQLGQKLAATIPSENSWPFEFHVIPQKEINAFALPGGPMFVNLGTILAAKNEAELAGVMGHEMAHVYMQHSAKQYEKASLTQGLAGLAGAILGAKGGALGSLAQMGVQIGAGTLMMKYSRSDESQADAVGAVILYRAGYNPQALADFFRTLGGEGSGGPQFLSDHPNPGNREAAIQKLIQEWPSKRFLANSSAFNRVRQQASGEKLYTGEEIAAGAKSGKWASLNQKNGAVFKGAPAASGNPGATPVSSTSGGPVSLQDVMPSGSFQEANLGPMSISRPENWDVITPQQQGGSVTIAPRAGLVSNGVGYGVVINGVKPQDGSNTNIDDITRQLVQSMQTGGNDLQASGSPQKITVAGVSGRSVKLQSTSPFPNSKGQSQKERDWLVTVPQQDGSVLYMVFVAPESEFDRLKPTFQTMLRSVKF